eukprot:GHVR01016828.1.p1 GENE.GHVR01016828.1~~GHVR01016828.1.p1  ORF type:complete len:240 (+),score=36.52 GHVR01016828.1:178-897(+)
MNIFENITKEREIFESLEDDVCESEISNWELSDDDLSYTFHKNSILSDNYKSETIENKKYLGERPRAGSYICDNIEYLREEYLKKIEPFRKRVQEAKAEFLKLKKKLQETKDEHNAKNRWLKVLMKGQYMNKETYKIEVMKAAKLIEPDLPDILSYYEQTRVFQTYGPKVRLHHKEKWMENFHDPKIVENLIETGHRCVATLKQQGKIKQARKLLYKMEYYKYGTVGENMTTEMNQLGN